MTKKECRDRIINDLNYTETLNQLETILHIVKMINKGEIENEFFRLTVQINKKQLRNINGLVKGILY